MIGKSTGITQEERGDFGIFPVVSTLPIEGFKITPTKEKDSFDRISRSSSGGSGWGFCYNGISRVANPASLPDNPDFARSRE